MTKVIPFDDSSLAEMKRVFAPLSMLLQVFGLYVPQDRKGVGKLLQWTYTGLFLLAAITNVIRSSFIFNPGLLRNMDILTSTAVFLVECGMGYIYVSTVVVMSLHYESLVDAFSKYSKKFGFVWKSKGNMYIRRICLISTVSAFGLTIYFLCCSIFLSNFPFDVLINEQTGLLKWILVGVLHIWRLCSIFTLCSMSLLYVFFTYCIKGEFDDINSRVHAIVHKPIDDDINVRRGDDIISLKRQHADVCRLLQKINNIVTHLIFVVYAAGLPVTCLLLYGVIRSSLDTENIRVLIIMQCFVAIKSICITVLGAVINSKAHSCLLDIYSLDLTNQPQETVHAVTQFLTFLTGPPIGYTVLGMLTVDASTILTISGTLLTYIVVILQF